MSYKCHNWTNEENVLINMKFPKNDVCEKHPKAPYAKYPNRIYTGGNNTNYPGCGKCECCLKNVQTSYKCSWTPGDKASLEFVPGKAQEMKLCKLNKGIYTGGNNTNYPGCNCSCCQKETHTINKIRATLDSHIQSTSQETNALISNIRNTSKNIDKIEKDLKATSNDLGRKATRQRNQHKDIKNKEKLLLSRERMLQLSIEKNIYKRKVIYTYISVICLVLLLLFSAYFFYNRK